MDYINLQNIQMLTWETDSAKRNKNNAVTLYLPVGQELKTGDKIFASNPSYSVGNTSTYEVITVIEKRKGSMSGYNHFTLETKWYKS